MANYYDILSGEAVKEISEINPKVSAKENFLEKVERNLNKVSDIENFKTETRNFRLKKGTEIQVDESPQMFPCPSCSFKSTRIIRVAQHMMKTHEKQFPYSKGSILAVCVY